MKCILDKRANTCSSAKICLPLRCNFHVILAQSSWKTQWSMITAILLLWIWYLSKSESCISLKIIISYELYTDWYSCIDTTLAIASVFMKLYLFWPTVVLCGRKLLFTCFVRSLVTRFKKSQFFYTHTINLCHKINMLTYKPAKNRQYT